jgi:hypothetical protein
MSTTTGPRLAVRNRVGLVIAGLLGAADMVSNPPAAVAAALLFPRATGNAADPFAIQDMGAPAVGVAVATVILGVSTIVCVVLTWRTGNRISARVVAAARVISVLFTVPVFLLQDMPAWIILIAAAQVLLNITTVILVLSRPAAPRG